MQILIICAILLFWDVQPLFSQVPTQDQFEPVYATVLEDKVNIRAGLGLNFEIIGQLNKTDRVVVIAQEYGWYKIKLPKEARCFVHKDYVEKGIVKANKLRIRAGAGVNFNVLGILKKGEAINIMVQEGDWLRITPPESCSGWVKKDYLHLGSPVRKRFSKQGKFKPEIFKLSSAPQKRIETQGIIEELGKIVNRPGTHKLIKGKKIHYYLKSDKIDLNHYVYRKVGVIGQLIDLRNYPYPVINVEQIIGQ